MNNLLTVSPSPHIRGKRTTRSVMGTVLLALFPAVIASVFLYGVHALLVLLTANVCCGLFEFIWCKARKLKDTTCDLSCFVTGTLLALTLPANLGELKNLWIVAFGALVAIIVVKEMFGGIGYNFVNPAITARIVLLVCFPDLMTATVHTNLTDAELASGATPLGDIAMGKTELLPSLTDMLIGNRAGALGEGCAIALIIGGIILIAAKVITWHIPVSFIVTVGLFTLATGSMPSYQLLAGGLLIGAFFMATDYTTSPDTAWGKLIFGVGCGLITAIIRVYGSYPEGVSFAILLMNIINPYIIKLTRKKAFGGVKS
ncbi:MAG: RnfABCDGE type electron transport complex subunit D [Eubacteriales bacterium]